MNMQASIEAIAATSGEWADALADYEAKRAISDAMPLGTDGEDEAVDAYCRAMDHLIEDVPARNLEQVSEKVDLALQRANGFERIFDNHATAIVADLERLCNPLAAFAFGWLQRWTYLGGDVTIDVTNPEKVWSGWPAYDLSPVAREFELLHEQAQRMQGCEEYPMSEQTRAYFRRLDEAKQQSSWEGGIRQLQQLLDAVPGGGAAVKAVLRVNSKLGRGRREA